jgi:HSP90 family molecular chaperone
LKEDAEDLLEEQEILRLIRTYSEFISFPIRLWTTKTKTKKVKDEKATKEKQEEADAKAKEEGKVWCETFAQHCRHSAFQFPGRISQGYSKAECSMDLLCMLPHTSA